MTTDFMRAVRHVPCALLLVALIGLWPDVAIAKGQCVPCGFAGLCDGVECGPRAAGCAPRNGILVFNSTSPPYAYWTLFAKKRHGTRFGRLGGKLEVYVDAGVPPASVPGFPVRRCRGSLCFGDNARFRGVVDGDRLLGKARYPNGEVCVFVISLMFGLGDLTEPNHFECREAAGALLSRGRLDLQGIRLFGCRQ